MINCRIKDLTKIFEKSNLQASEGKDKGNYPFYTSSPVLSKYYDDYLYEGNAITMGTGGMASINYVDQKYATSTDCYNFTANEYTKFVYYYLLSQLKEINDIGFQGMGLKHLQKDYINTMKITIPDDYKRITNFLDKKILGIDNIIEKTKETIEEYKKYKIAIITEKITQGINTQVKYKESNIDWIGKIPQNWKLEKGKYILQLLSRDIKEDDDVITCFRDGEVTLRKNRRIEGFTISEKEIGYQGIEKDDLVVHGMDGFAGAIGISDSRGKATPVLNVLDTEQNKRYIMYYLRRLAYNGIFLALSTGIRIRTCDTNWNKIKELPFLIPPLDEQEEIVKYIDAKCDEIDKLILSKQKLIDELEQYKKSLIYEYVTGKKEVKENNLLKRNDTEEIKINCKDNIFAQAILLCKIIEKLNKHNLGRVKAEKALYLIEKDIGFNFDNNYAREAAGPLSEAIYKCESVISKKNKWVKVNKVKKHIEYEILSDFNKYIKYYEKYYSDYDNQIENIINIIKNYSTDKAEMVATLYASWNDFIIKKEEISDLKIIRDVRENWNDTKKRFKENEWLAVLKEMKQVGLIPKGNGNLTIIKEQ